jgi:truncated hemoglobin YjbI
MASIYRTRLRKAFWAAALALSAGAAGCAIPIRLTDVDPEVPRRSLPQSIDAGLDTLDQAETKRKIEGLVKSPEMREIERELIAGLLDGTLTAMGDEERSKRVGGLMSKALGGIFEGASAQMGPEMREAIAASVGAVVARSVKEAAKGLRDAEIGEQISTAMTEQVGPAMQKALRENIGRGLAEVLKDEEVRRELGETARVLGREMVAGATEALAQAQPPNQVGSTLDRISQLAGKGSRLFDSITWALGLIILALAVLIVRLMAQAKRYREDAHRREAEARLLEEVAKASEGKPWSNELVTTLKERLKREEEARAALARSRRRLRARKDDQEKPPTDVAARPSFA